MRKFFKNQFTFLLLGFVFWLPIIILILILVFLLNNIEDYGRKFLLLFLPDRFYYSGFGIVFGILLVYLSGVILKHTRIKTVFSRIPILGLFFGGGEVITIDRLTHLSPCLFLLSPTCISYGWILSEEKVKVSREKVAFTLINVYYPNVPSLVTGQVFPVRKSTVIKLGNPSKEILDLLLYAFRSPKDLIYLPWEDESSEDLKERAGSFGLTRHDESR
jgi:uncharacterized membrane protein